MPHSPEIEERHSIMSATAALMPLQALPVVSLIWNWLEELHETSSIHAMWTSPENTIEHSHITLLPSEHRHHVENGTIMPADGDRIFYRFRHTWGASEQPIHDIGLLDGSRAKVAFSSAAPHEQRVRPCHHRRFAEICPRCREVRRNANQN